MPKTSPGAQGREAMNYPKNGHDNYTSIYSHERVL